VGDESPVGPLDGVVDRPQGRVVRLTGRDARCQRDAVAVDDQVQLGAEAAARAAQGMVGRLVGNLFPPAGRAPAAERLARMQAASTHQRPRSMRPRSSKVM
jgi:hypothetical protein